MWTDRAVSRFSVVAPRASRGRRGARRAPLTIGLVGLALFLSQLILPPAAHAGDVPRPIRTSNNLCVDVRGASHSDGAPVDQYGCHLGGNQLWRFQFVRWLPNGYAAYAIINVHSGKCLEILGWSTAWGAKAVQWQCQALGSGGNANQLWGIDSFGPGTCKYRFWNVHSRLYLDVPGDQATWGLQLQQWPFNGSRAQNFFTAYFHCI